MTASAFPCTCEQRATAAFMSAAGTRSTRWRPSPVPAAAFRWSIHATLPRAEALALICGFFATGMPPEIDGTVTLGDGKIGQDARWVEQDGI